MEALQQISSVCSEQLLNQYKREQSKTDKAIDDLLHIAEKYELNAAQGYELYRMLHEARIHRRELKNAVEIIIAASKVMKRQENANYRPKVLKNLFDAKGKVRL